MQIQSLGMEIRRIGNMESLYQEVDLVLRKHEIGMLVSKSVQEQTVAHALQKMLNTNAYLDVCTIQSCAELCQINIPRERIAVYRSVHCMHWNEMMTEFRQMMVAMILDDFRPILQHEK